MQQPKDLDHNADTLRLDKRLVSHRPAQSHQIKYRLHGLLSGFVVGEQDGIVRKEFQKGFETTRIQDDLDGAFLGGCGCE